MKTLIVKAVIILAVILFSETALYAHEKTRPELSPLQKAQLLGRTKAQITCSGVLLRVFPNEVGVAELANEIISDSLDTFKYLKLPIADEDVVKLAKDGFYMWDESSEKGRLDLLKMCGQDLLKEGAVVYYGYMPPDTQIFM